MAYLARSNFLFRAMAVRFIHRPSHGERSEGEEPAGGVESGGWPQATCKDTGRAAGNVDTPSHYCGRASCAPEKRTARPQDGRGRAEAGAGAEAQRVRLKTEGARATGTSRRAY